jgi:hypothetical protein
MPKDSWTPEETEIINQLVRQANVGTSFPDEGVTVTFSFNLSLPTYTAELPPPPSFQPSLSGYAAAPTQKEAVDAADKQIEATLSQAEETITAWLATVGDYRRRFKLYREVVARATKRIDRQPS